MQALLDTMMNDRVLKEAKKFLAVRRTDGFLRATLNGAVF
jgi:hypothetical protein